MPTRQTGQTFGCRDSGKPKPNYSNSRLLDLLDAAEAWGGQAAKLMVWNQLPYKSKMAFNWSRWSYVEAQTKI